MRVSAAARLSEEISAMRVRTARLGRIGIDAGYVMVLRRFEFEGPGHRVGAWLRV